MGPSIKTPQKRPAPAQAGPKAKKAHMDNDRAKDRKRSQPVTAPIQNDSPSSSEDEDEDADEDEIEVEDENMNDKVANEEMMDVGTTPASAKDPNGMFFSKDVVFILYIFDIYSCTRVS